MSKSLSKIIGIFTLVISIFFILGGLFMFSGDKNNLLPLFSLIFGVILLIIGTLLYKIIKVED